MKLGNDEVQLTKIVEKMGLTNLTPQIDTDTKYVTQPDVNRPALQLAGFYDHFDNERVQIIGYVEEAYIAEIPSAHGEQYSMSYFLPFTAAGPGFT